MTLWQIILFLVGVGAVWYIGITYLTFGKPAIAMVINVLGALAVIWLVLALTGIGNIHIGR